ncbi:TIM barrel protein [Opitutales bacterium]|nr:TIM barrel protein [Opitutales bacterium]
MNNPINRRSFLESTGKIALAGSAFPVSLTAKHHKKMRFTLGLSQYSLRSLLKDGSLDALDFPKFTVDQFGIKAIDLWEGGLPKDKLDDPKYLTTMRKKADQAGTDLFLLMSGALDASAKKRVASTAKISASFDRAVQLGAPMVRIFLKAPGTDPVAGLQASVEALKPLADEAAKKNLTIAIEPGASSLSQKGAFLAEVATKLKHPALKLMPDFGKLKDNVYKGTKAMLPHTVTVSCKMHSFDKNGNQPDFDYPRLMKMIKQSAYKGILAIEWEGSALEPVAGVKASKKLIEKSLS